MPRLIFFLLISIAVFGVVRGALADEETVRFDISGLGLNDGNPNDGFNLPLSTTLTPGTGYKLLITARDNDFDNNNQNINNITFDIEVTNGLQTGFVWRVTGDIDDSDFTNFVTGPNGVIDYVGQVSTDTFAGHSIPTQNLINAGFAVPLPVAVIFFTTGSSGSITIDLDSNPYVSGAGTANSHYAIQGTSYNLNQGDPIPRLAKTFVVGSGSATPTYTRTATPTTTATKTRTSTSTPTPTFTIMPTFTFTRTTTATPTASPTYTRTPTRTATATSTATRTSTQIVTFTYTSTATASATPTRTSSATHTATFTPSRTATGTSTPTLTFTLTATATSTPSATRTPTLTATSTSTVTRTSTRTATVTSTATRTNTQIVTFTYTSTATASATPTRTSSATHTATFTPSRTATGTSTPTLTFTLTATATSTPSATRTPTLTATSTSTVTRTSTRTATVTSTATRTNTGTITFTSTQTRTATVTGTVTSTPTPTPTATITPTATTTQTPTITFTITATETPTPTPTQTITPLPQFNITGTITMDGFGLAGVMINAGSLGTVTTDSAGRYIIAGATLGYQFSLVPSLEGYVFLPQSKCGEVSGGTIVNFDALVADRVYPILECVNRNSDGSYTAHFGYHNTNSQAVTIPISNKNKFNPPPKDRNQPISFLPGRVADILSLKFGPKQITWRLNGLSAVATKDSLLCCGSPIDQCGVCGGDGSSCLACPATTVSADTSIDHILARMASATDEQIDVINEIKALLNQNSAPMPGKAARLNESAILFFDSNSTLIRSLLESCSLDSQCSVISRCAELKFYNDTSKALLSASIKLAATRTSPPSRIRKQLRALLLRARAIHDRNISLVALLPKPASPCAE